MEQVLTIGCPDCRDFGKPEVPLKTRPGFFGLYCENNHVFQDTEQLNNRKPTSLKAPPPKPRLPMPGEGKFDVSVSDAVRDKLNKRFGANAAATISAVLGSICEEGTFIVGEAEAIRLGEIFGQKVTNSQMLTGLVYNLRNSQAEAPPPLPQKNTVMNPGDIVLKFDNPGYLEKLKDRAKFRGQTVDQVLADVIVHGLDNGWF